MKSRCTGATRRISMTRGTVLGLAVIAMIALTSVLVWGCGESASQPQDLTAGPTQSVAAETAPIVTTPAGQTERSSVHERVMAEHRLRMAAAAEAAAEAEAEAEEAAAGSATNRLARPV